MNSYFIETYGCQMNVSDSEVVAGLLEQMGLRPADSVEEADVVILNTCTVRETAAERIFGRASQLGALKRRRPGMLLGISGCLPQQRGMVDRLLERAPHVDMLFGPDQVGRLKEIVARARDGDVPVVETGWDEGGLDGMPRVRTRGARAWVSIMKGCTNFCSYCIVPYVRGPERSRRPESVVAEVRGLVSEGFIEVTLLGQNVNAYGRDLEDGSDFVGLLEELNGIDGLERIRFTTSHPRDFTLEMVDAMFDLDRVCEHFHLPVQAGSDRILNRMNRGYTRDHYLSLTRHIRSLMPRASITTDIIVAFPGETEDDFEQTLDLCRQVEFDSAYTFIYSPRTGTRAYHMEQTVDAGVARSRLNRLMETLHPMHLARNQSLVGSEVEVLIEGASPRDASVLQGRTRTNKIVLASGGDTSPRLATARVTSAGTWTLKGELLGGDGR